MSSLPEGIYVEILSRLPVKSLLRCKCVCKSWFQLISDPYFVKKHLNLSIQKKNGSLMIGNYEESSLYSISYDALSSFAESDSTAVAIEMNFPCESLKRKPTVLLASGNGLVWGSSGPFDFLFLWNPATKEYKRLPQSSQPKCYSGYGLSRLQCVLEGFGYDYKTDDYKLVSIVKFIGSSEVYVYSLKSNSWKSYSISFPYKLLDDKALGVICNGALHWHVEKDKTPSIVVSMDISKERFKELQPPMIPRKDGAYILNIEELEGCLCALVDFNSTSEVWVMQEYRVQESWIKLCAIRIESVECDFLYLMGSLMNGDILIMDQGLSKMIIISDPKYGTVRRLNLNTDGLNLRRAVSCFESLVSLNAIAAVDEGQREKSCET